MLVPFFGDHGSCSHNHPKMWVVGGFVQQHHVFSVTCFLLLTSGGGRRGRGGGGLREGGRAVRQRILGYRMPP